MASDPTETCEWQKILKTITPQSSESGDMAVSFNRSKKSIRTINYGTNENKKTLRVFMAIVVYILMTLLLCRFANVIDDSVSKQRAERPNQ